MLKNDHLDAWDRETFFHPSTHLAQFARGDIPNRIVTGAKGVNITDRDGNKLLDAFAGLYCVNIGYGHTEVADAIAAQAKELAYYHAYAGHGTEASITLARMVIDRAPANMSRVFFGLGGSDANETNIKLVWYYNNALGRPEKKKIISRWRGYHGSGLMTGSLTGLHLFHRQFDLPFDVVKHTEAPYYYRREDRGMTEQEFSNHCAAKLEEMILAEGPETVAAFIGEPALATGGMVPPPEGYWEAIQTVLKRYDILLIADEVVTGFGRMGTMFGSEHFGMQPDIITIAKGLTSAYAPLSGSIVSEQVWQGLAAGTDKFGVFGHGWTYAAHPIGSAAGIANLKLLDDLNLIANAAEMGAYLKQGLNDALGEHGNVGEIRGEGLLLGVELVKDRYHGPTFFDATDTIGLKVHQALMRRGVISRAMPESDIIGIAPPFCITAAECDQVIGALKESVVEVLGEG